MFQILIVDDEFIEREGMKRLIQKYKLPLTVLEAENGEEAMGLLRTHPVDILLTDIKMPFMDGLELCRQARDLLPELTIMIVSAYGEFEYAQRAIDYQIFSYLLKPIDVNEFIRAFTQVIELCEKDQEQEKEHRLLGLIHAYQHQALHPGGEVTSGIDFARHRVQMMLIDYDLPVFDAEQDRVPVMVKSAVATPFEYVNVNEHQSLLFFLLDRKGQPQMPEPAKLLEQLIRADDGRVTLVAGSLLNEESELAAEFKLMESVLEDKFFYQGSTVLFTDGSQGKEELSDTISKLMDTVYWHLEMKDDYGFRKGVELFFKTVDGSGQHSAIYIKYLCTQLVSKVWETSGRDDNQAFKGMVEGIFGSKSLAALKAQVHEVMAMLGKEAEEPSAEQGKKVIKDILKLIEDNYMSDISLKWLADRVFLTQTYLSYLFHKEVGQTIVKFITLVRMQKAAALLRDTHLTIAEISQQVGFMNNSYFCKMFKIYHGCSPAKFRETAG
ncbi:response regulator transcription factor [Paenibacillus whitsoniae]|uniref:Response regulator n=1 Tax=Paenibacillus whitsoniae TaxID=2496558 RepID=A0A3S0AS45_9BACL|nr:response regulator [Paenibacillus whitsoniae]RTE11357.1 response regulator [Paenibacillus whitsoniae]